MHMRMKYIFRHTNTIDLHYIAVLLQNWEYVHITHTDSHTQHMYYTNMYKSVLNTGGVPEIQLTG